jgi:hypothetical protein
MATFVDVWSRLFASGMEQSREAVGRTEIPARLRPFANEDILFYVKRIDNSGVVRETDRASQGKCWKLIGSVGGAAVLLICVLLPSSYGLLAGFQIQSLRQESQRLAAEQASLELQEAQLLSPARMEELARAQQFVDPAPRNVVYLDGDRGSLAMNGK